MTIKTGIQLYAVKDPWAEDQEKTLERIAGLGIEGVEAFGLGEPVLFRNERVDKARTLQRRIDAAGLELSSAHAILPDPADAGWWLEEMAELGTPLALASTTERVLGFTRDALSDGDRLLRFADRMNSLTDLASNHGLRIGYHNHWWEWVDVAGRPAYDRLVEALDPRVVLEIDLFWAQSAGQDIAALVSQYGSRVELVHVKDGNGVLGVPQVPAGSGEIKLADALSAGAESLRWQILEVDLIAPGEDIWDVVGAGAAWLKDRS